MVRVRRTDLPVLQSIARSFNLSLPDYLSMIAKAKGDVKKLWIREEI